MSQLEKSNFFDLREHDLQKYIDANMNVLLEGSHGIGKTEVIKALWEKNGLRYKYFSSSTMDPYIDFVGAPRPSTPMPIIDENTGIQKQDKYGNPMFQQHLEMILPREFADDEVDAIFFDEFNRAPDKVINAVMELIQFKSINGRKFKKLRFIWAAINPHDDDDTYAVVKLDPAVIDRFHGHLYIRPDFIAHKYYISTYGEIADVFIKWWNEEERYKLVSPRRLEYAIKAYDQGIDLAQILPLTSNVKDLKTRLRAFGKAPTVYEEGEKIYREDGNYTMEEMAQAYSNRDKIELSLKHSQEMYDTIFTTNPVLLNYVHPEVLENFCFHKRDNTLVFAENFDRKINTNKNRFSDKAEKQIFFHLAIEREKYAHFFEEGMFKDFAKANA